MKTHLVKVVIILDQFDDSDAVEHIVKVLEGMNHRVMGLDDEQPKIITESITKDDILETNIQDED